MYQFNQFIRSKDIDFCNANNKGFSKWLYSQYKKDNYTNLYLTCDAMQDTYWPREAEDIYSYYTYVQNLIDNQNAYDEILNDFTVLYSAYLKKPIIFLEQEQLENLSYLIQSIEVNDYDIIESYGKILSSNNLRQHKNLELVLGYSFIYFLYFEDSTEIDIRYCGKTGDPVSRLRQHINSPNTWQMSQWIYSNLIKKKPLNMVLFNTVSICAKQDTLVENAYIMGLRYLGYNLFNKQANSKA